MDDFLISMFTAVLADDMVTAVFGTTGIVIAIVLIGAVAMVIRFYKKAIHY